MPDISAALFLVIFLALAFDYINGFHDTANAIATSVSTRALTPRQAIWMAAALNFAGALLSTGVAKTIGGDIVKMLFDASREAIVNDFIKVVGQKISYKLSGWCWDKFSAVCAGFFGDDSTSNTPALVVRFAT